MPRAVLGTITLRTSNETKDWFRNSFESSDANSQGDFLQKLLEKWNAPEPHHEPSVQTVVIERNLQPHEFILSLTPVQLFALKNTVTSYAGFAEEQNQIIESLKGDPPFMYFGNLYDPAFANVWVKNIPILNTMTPEEKEKATRHNIAAFLINMFMYNLIEGKIAVSAINARSLKSFIEKQKIVKQPPEPGEIKNQSNESSISR